MSVRLEAANTEGLTRTASTFDQNADYTWCAWFYFHSVAAAPHLFYAAADGSPYNNLDGTLIAGGVLRIQAKDSAGNDIDFNDGATALSANAWYHVAQVRSGSTLKVSLRPSGGSHADQVSITAAVTGRSQAARMSLGIRHNNDRPLDASIAYARVWTGTAFSAAQLDAEAESATPVITSGLWQDTPLSGSADLADDSGNGRDWTAVGTLSNGQADPSDIGGASGGQAIRTYYTHRLRRL